MARAALKPDRFPMEIISGAPAPSGTPGENFLQNRGFADPVGPLDYDEAAGWPMVFRRMRQP